VHIENLVQIQACKATHREPTGARKRVTTVGPGKGCIYRSREMDKTGEKYHE
jgi:hypothetical protein